MSKPYESYESGAYLANNPTWDEEDSGWKAGQVLRLLAGNRLSPRSIADVGCGSGGVLAALHDAMPQVEYSGFELAPDASRFWEKHKDRNIRFSVGDLSHEEGMHFDVLLLLDVVEHVPNPHEFLSALRNRADHFVLHIPLDLSALSVLREEPLLLVRRKVGHIHYFTKELALSLLRESGFEVKDWCYTQAFSSVPHASWKSKLAQIPRRVANAIDRDWGARLLGGDTLMVLAKAARD